jgi:hypothetical protein
MASVSKDKRQCSVAAAKERDVTLVQVTISQEGS